ncbi:MAG: hypothetical protein J5676_13015 [Bacteroidaceae bacterium]|nr:hypothetical protein [Bacteroidaceae bacterium]
MNKSIKNILKEVGRFILAIAIMVLLLEVYIHIERVYYHNKINRLSPKRETVKAYVFDRTGRDWKSIHYRFVVKGKEYYGESPCSRKRPYPDEGDSIVVYYDANDPDVNMWQGCFDELSRH